MYIVSTRSPIKWVSIAQVDSNNYPRDNGRWWLGCSGNNILNEGSDIDPQSGNSAHALTYVTSLVLSATLLAVII